MNDTIYTILFTAAHMEPLLFAATTRTKLAHKVRDHVNQLIDESNGMEPVEEQPKLGQYVDLQEAAAWLQDAYGYSFEIEAHVEDTP